MRLHRSLQKKVQKIDPNKVANKAEGYLDGVSLYRTDLKAISGLISADRIRQSIKKVDALEREILKLEDKIDRLAEKRAIEAVKLEEYLSQNLDVVGQCFDADELRDFL